MKDNPEFSLRSIFNQAVEIEEAGERAAYLDQACGHDAALRQRVESLLRAHDQAGPWSEVNELGPGGTLVIGAETFPSSGTPGERVGRYKLLQIIGEGGYGVVWMAEQEEPVRRRVALKVIKVGMDTRTVIARFEAERQALAMMDHPNIAKVFDAGATETGRPYFVMELVRGVKITDYCDQNNLSTAERLELFTKACQAVQHAHQKGVIHRDIKPSNVLVTPNDPDRLGVLKVIDFGIAKATGQQLTEKTLFTEFNQFIGTPAYMSPEQAGRRAQDIDTRSDVYSLGVLLYELLTGKTPFDTNELLRRGLDEMLRTIREVEPVRPSTRLTQEHLRAGASSHSAIRNPKSAIDKDLDWIVMKCLEKDRSRRYETANGLAADIQRHLSSETIVARPPSSLYRFQKFARRNKAAFVTATAVATALVIGAAVSAWQAIRATRAERSAEAAQASAEQRLYNSLVGEARATRIARRAGYREEVFALLRQANALGVPHKDMAALRREAAACLGDSVGLPPRTLGAFPDKTTLPPPSTVHLDPAGRLAGFALSDGSLLLRETASGRDVARLKADLPVWSFRFDVRGERIVSVHLPASGAFADRLSGATVQVWGQSGGGQWTETSKADLPGAYECLRAGDRLLIVVVNFQDRVLELMNALSGDVLERIPFPDRLRIEEFRARPAISPDAHWLAIPTAGEVEIWSLTEHKWVTRLTLGTFNLSRAVFSPNGRHFACLSGRGCFVFQTNDFSRVTMLGELANGWVQVAIGPDSTLALPLFEQKRVRLWNVPRNKEIATLDVPFTPYKADFSANGEWLLISGLNEACVVRLHVNAEKLSLAGHALAVPMISFSPDGQRLAAVDKERMLTLWDAATGHPVWKTGPLPRQGAQSVGYSPDGRFLATAHWDSSRVHVWDAHTGQLLQNLGVARPGGVGWSTRFSPDGRYLINSHTPAGVTIWERDAASPDKPFGESARAFEGGYYNLAIAPDSQRLAFINFHGAPKLYCWEFTGDAEPVVLTEDILRNGQNASFTPDSRHLVFLDRQRNVAVFDPVARTKVRSFPTLDASHPGQWAGEPNLLLSPDGEQVAVSSPSHRGVDIWEMATGRWLHSLPEQAASIEWLDWSPDSRRLAVSRSDGEVTIWNLTEVEQVLTKLGLNP